MKCRRSKKIGLFIIQPLGGTLLKRPVSQYLLPDAVLMANCPRKRKC